MFSKRRKNLWNKIVRGKNMRRRSEKENWTELQSVKRNARSETRNAREKKKEKRKGKETEKKNGNVTRNERGTEIGIETEIETGIARKVKRRRGPRHHRPDRGRPDPLKVSEMAPHQETVQEELGASRLKARTLARPAAKTGSDGGHIPGKKR